MQIISGDGGIRKNGLFSHRPTGYTFFMDCSIKGYVSGDSIKGVAQCGEASMGCGCKRGVNIVKGSDVTLSLKLENDCKPYSLASFVGATAYFKGIDQAIAASGALASADLGTINVALTPVQSANLEEGEMLDFQLNLDLGATKKIVIFEAALNVISPIF